MNGVVMSGKRVIQVDKGERPCNQNQGLLGNIVPETKRLVKEILRG